MDNNELVPNLSLEEPAGEAAAKAAPDATGWRSKLTSLARLEEGWQDTFIVAGLLTLFFLVHRRVEAVEFGGDAVMKWHFVRQWWFGFDWRTADLDHHSGRMGVNLVAWLAQALFGHGFRSYYFAPFFIAMLQIPFVYGICKQISNRLSGVLAVLVITYLQTVHRSASQLLPDGFAGTYAIMTAYFYVRFVSESEPRRRHFLVGMGLMGFLAYLAKETAVFFFPGMVIAVWLVRKKPRDVITFLGVMFAGFLMETAFYSIFTKYPSRYQVVRSVHGADGIWQQVTFGQLFDRFSRFHDGWKYLFFFSLAAGLWLLVQNQKDKMAGRGLVLMGFSQVFFLTFGVRGFNPVELWESFEPRYIEPFMPFAASMTGIYLGATAEAAWSGRSWPRWVERFGPTGAYTMPVWALALLAAFGSTQQALAQPERSPSGMVVGRHLSKLCNDAYSRNLPVAQERKIKVLQVMYDVYLDDKALLKRGRLPKFAEVMRSEAGYNFVVRNKQPYARGRFAQLLSERCVLVVTRNRRGDYEASHQDPLPPRCDALLQEPLQGRRDATPDTPPEIEPGE